MRMTRNNSVAVILLSILVLASVFTGCNSGIQEDTFGTITIAFPSKGITSDLATEITRYVITLTYQPDPSYTHTKTVSKTDQNATFSSLLPGNWIVQVDGMNTTGTKLATGSSTAKIDSGKTNTVIIPMVKAEGSGTLKVNVTWTEDVVHIENVQITVSAKLAGSQDEAKTITMVNSSSSASSTGQTTLTQGNYFITATFTDETNTYADGRVDVVQILADGDSTVSFDFPLSIGGLNIEIEDPDFSMLDLSITGIGDSHYVTVGTSVTLEVTGTATPNSYQWYENGVLLTGETSSQLILTVEDYKTYSLTCLVSEGDTYDSATVEFTGIESTQDTQDGSEAKFNEARSLIETMIVSDAPIVNTRYVYNTLTEAVALNPNNMDAVLTLGMFDLVRFLLDDEIQTVMREGFGYTNYPSTEQELYADILSLIYGFVPNGYNRFFKEYIHHEGEAEEYPMLAPLLSGYLTSDGEGPAYLLQMFSNLAASGYDVDDVFDGILDSLGRSFERTANNIETLSDDAKSYVASNDSTPYFISKAEAMLISSQLYTIRAFASILNAIELGFDIENILDSITYDASTNNVEFATPELSPFANGFLQADSEKGLAYITAAKNDMLKANELMSDALDAIAARTAADNTLLISPDSGFFDAFTDGWTPLDPDMSWDEFLDIVAVFDILLANEKTSMEAGGGTNVIIPIDIMEYAQFTYDEEIDENVPNLAPLFDHYSNPTNWPTAIDMKPDTGFNAIGFDAGIFFTREFNLLATILEIDQSGEPVLYYYNEGTNSFAVATTYHPGEYAYFKIPDVTLGGIIDKANSPYLWSEYEQMIEPAPFTQDPLKIREEGDAVALYVLEQVLSIPISYPLSYHALTAKENTPSDVLIEFCPSSFRNKMTGDYITTEANIPITSTGSFYLGAIELIKFRASFEKWELDHLFDLDAPINDSKTNAYRLDQNVEMTFYWNSDDSANIPSSAWFSITPESSGTYCIEPDIWNGAEAVFYDASNQETTLDGKNAIALQGGTTYFLELKLNPSYNSSYYYDIIWYEEDSEENNYSYSTAASLSEDTVFEGITSRRPDYFKFTPTTNQITISIEFSNPFPYSSYRYSGYAVLINESYTYSQIEFEDGSQNFQVTPGQECRIEIRNAEYLTYTLEWDDTGSN